MLAHLNGKLSKLINRVVNTVSALWLLSHHQMPNVLLLMYIGHSWTTGMLVSAITACQVDSGAAQDTEHLNLVCCTMPGFSFDHMAVPDGCYLNLIDGQVPAELQGTFFRWGALHMQQRMQRRLCQSR
jgi:hypothetical protein